MKKHKLPIILMFVSPALLCYLLVFFYPTIRTTVMSFFNIKNIMDGVHKWEFVGFDNYLSIWKSDLFVQSMVNFIKIWFFGGIIVFIIAMLMSVILTSGIKGKSFFRAVIYLPNVVSAVAMGTMWIQYVYNPKYGLLKTLFEFLGLDNLAAIKWTTPDNIFWAMLIAFNFGMVGYFMLIYISGIERIPATFYEAATLEGANIFVKFYRITLPLLKGVIKTTLVLWTISDVGFFVWSQVFSMLNPVPGTVTPMVYMYQSIFGNNMIVTDRNVGLGATVGVLLMVIVVIVFALTNILIKEEDVEF